MEKCKWIEGKFSGCENYTPANEWKMSDFEELRNGTTGNIDWYAVARKVQELSFRKPEK